MKKLLLTSASILAMTSASLAADTYSGGGYKDGPAYVADTTWTGFYLGVHGGYANGDWDGILAYKGGDAGFNPAHRTLDANGWLGGAQLGYNKQLGTVVLGAEADISWTGFSGTGTYDTRDYDGGADSVLIYRKEHDASLDYFGTVRGRVGYAVGNYLPYVTGGLAWGKAKEDILVTFAQGPNGQAFDKVDARGSVKEDHVGWTIGAGVEAIVSDGWSVKAEYLRVDLGEENYLFKGKYGPQTLNNPANPFNTDSFKSDLSFDVFRVGLNYKFGAGDYEPLK